MRQWMERRVLWAASNARGKKCHIVSSHTKKSGCEPFQVDSMDPLLHQWPSHSYRTPSLLSGSYEVSCNSKHCPLAWNLPSRSKGNRAGETFFSCISFFYNGRRRKISPKDLNVHKNMFLCSLQPEWGYTFTSDQAQRKESLKQLGIE